MILQYTTFKKALLNNWVERLNKAYNETMSELSPCARQSAVKFWCFDSSVIAKKIYYGISLATVLQLSFVDKEVESNISYIDCNRYINGEDCSFNKVLDNLYAYDNILIDRFAYTRINKCLSLSGDKVSIGMLTHRMTDLYEGMIKDYAMALTKHVDDIYQYTSTIV